MKKRFAAAISAILLLLAPICSVGTVSAMGSDTLESDNPILCGLLAGVNMAVGSGQTCATFPSRTSSHKTTVVSSTSPATGTPVSLPPSATYAALGDSVAAGLGLAASPTASAQDIACGRSPQAYPSLVAAKLHFTLVDIACSGATAGDTFTEQEAGGQDLPPQLDTAFASGIPHLVTMTAGANDAHWTGFLRTCFVTNCATDTDTVLANSFLVILQFKLFILFNSLAARSDGTPPTTIVTGYYNPVSTRCTTLPQQITPAEVNWINGEVNALNQTIQNVSSQFSFTKFVPINFSGHDICSPQPWVQGLSAPAPFHPTAQGQKVIAQSVLTALGH